MAKIIVKDSHGDLKPIGSDNITDMAPFPITVTIHENGIIEANSVDGHSVMGDSAGEMKERLSRYDKGVYEKFPVGIYIDEFGDVNAHFSSWSIDDENKISVIRKLNRFLSRAINEIRVKYSDFSLPSFIILRQNLHTRLGIDFNDLKSVWGVPIIYHNMPYFDANNKHDICIVSLGNNMKTDNVSDAVSGFDVDGNPIELEIGTMQVSFMEKPSNDAIDYFSYVEEEIII